MLQRPDPPDAHLLSAYLSGQLAVIPDHPTQETLSGLVGRKYFWIGATDEADEGVWTWVDGSSIIYNNFLPGQPRGGSRENFLVLDNNDAGRWHDYPNSSSDVVGYICEWPDKPSFDKNSILEWSNRSGTTIQGKFVRFENSKVVILKDGKQVTLTFEMLSDESQEQTMRITGSYPQTVTFDWQKAEVKEISGQWKVIAGDAELLDYKDNKANAEKALAVIRHYRMNSKHTIGSGRNTMQFWLVNGRAPVGLMPGSDASTFNLNTIRVVGGGRGYYIMGGANSIKYFEDRRAEAETGVVMIRKYQFDCTCYVGRPHAPMQYFIQSKR